MSDWQAEFLVWVLGLTCDYETLPDGLVRSAFQHWGVPIGKLEPGTARSESASQSRSIKRLEDRGLIKRRNATSGDKYQDDDSYGVQTRTTRVQLTPEGRALAERLSDAT